MILDLDSQDNPCKNPIVIVPCLGLLAVDVQRVPPRNQ